LAAWLSGAELAGAGGWCARGYGGWPVRAPEAPISVCLWKRQNLAIPLLDAVSASSSAKEG